MNHIKNDISHMKNSMKKVQKKLEFIDIFHNWMYTSPYSIIPANSMLTVLNSDFSVAILSGCATMWD